MEFLRCGKTKSKRLLERLNGWISPAMKSPKLRFKNHYETIAFVNAIAWLSHRENPSSSLEVSFNQCCVRHITHAIGGLSENDFICAAKVDAALYSRGGRRQRRCFLTDSDTNFRLNSPFEQGVFTLPDAL